MILVTGAGGFIGRHFVKKALDSGQEIVALTRCVDKYTRVGSETVIEGDLTNWEVLGSKLLNRDFETCVHLAWEGIPDYSYDKSVKNLYNSLAVLRLCEELGVHNLVISGSCWEYKDPNGCIRTNHEMDYSNPFKASKQSVHMLSSAFCSEKDIHLNWMRIFYAYGPGQREGSLIPYIIKCFREGTVPALNGMGNENDFVYVGDVADALLRVATEHTFPETLNIGTGNAVKVADIVRKVAQPLSVKLPRDLIADDIPIGKSFYADAEEMLENYGWRYTTSIEEGINRMVESIVGRNNE